MSEENTTRQQNQLAKLETALNLVDQGFYVFPLKNNGKTPAHIGWQEEATTDSETIRHYFGNGVEHNIGISTEKYFKLQGEAYSNAALVVVDIDTKDGKQGNNTIHHLDALGYTLPPTLEFTTASGGRHLVYYSPYPLAGGANKLGTHVDIKSSGGYIVGEGSTIHNTPYHRSKDLPIAKVPDWLETKTGRPLLKQADTLANNTSSTLTTDSPQTLARAEDFILHHAPTAQSGNRNDTAYKVACRLHDLGVSQPQAQHFIHIWNKNSCFPHLSIEEAEAVTISAYHTAKLSAGNDQPHTFFIPHPDDPKDENQLSKKKLFYIKAKDSEVHTGEKPLIENYLEANGLSILYGDSNTGKTFIALDLAFHIATGQAWNGNETTKGAVIYLAAEGGRSALNRLQAIKKHYNNSDFPLALIPCQINLLNSIKDFNAFIDIIKQAEADTDLGPTRLIVIDTLSRVLSGGNENDSQDMGDFVGNLTALKEHFKTHVLVVHHSGKDAARGARGHSLLRAAVDTELEIADNLILIKKQRDMEFAKPQGFELQPIEVALDYRGKPITSCVVNYIDAELRAAFANNHRLTERDLVALLALERCEQGRSLRGFDNVVDQKVWAQCCKDFDITEVPGAKKWPESVNAFSVVFKRTRDRLIGFGRVVEVEDKQWAKLKKQHDNTHTTNTVVVETTTTTTH